MTKASHKRDFALHYALLFDPYQAADKLGIPADEVPELRTDEAVLQIVRDRVDALADIAAILTPDAIYGLLLTRATSPTQLRDIARSAIEQKSNPVEALADLLQQATATSEPTSTHGSPTHPFE